MTNDSELFRVSVKAVIHIDDCVVLLRKFDGKWDLPGGRLETGEAIQQSLLREVIEEMGLSVSMGPLVYCGVRRREPPKQNVVVVAHLCTLDGSLDEIVLSEEHTGVRLITIDDLPDLEIADSYHEALENAFQFLKDHRESA